MSKVKRRQPKLKVKTYFECHLRATVSSLGKLLRTPLTSFMTVMVIGIALALPVNFYVMIKNMQNLSQKWDNNSAQISLYLKMNITSARVQKLISQLKADPKISEVKYISAQQGLQEFSKVLGTDQVVAMLSKNPLPELIIINPIPKLRSAQAITTILNAMKALPEVKMVQLDLQWLQRLENIIILVRHIILALAFLLGIGIISIVGNTIRLAVQNERKEIEVMNLVGATNAFIRRPFLYTGVWYGLFGGMIAWFLEITVLMWLRNTVTNLASSYGSDFYIRGLGFGSGIHLLIISVLLSLIGSWIVVNRHIKKIEIINE